MWRIFPLDIFSPHLSCGEISPRDRFSPPFSCGEIFHLTDLSPHFSCGEISPCDRVSPHLSCGEIFHLTTCHGENFSTWPIFSPQTPSVASVTNIRYDLVLTTGHTPLLPLLCFSLPWLIPPVTAMDWDKIPTLTENLVVSPVTNTAREYFF